MEKTRRVIIVGGLSGTSQNPGIERVTNHWKKEGIEREIFDISWKDSQRLEPKLRRLLERVDYLHSQGNTISLVGLSAGGPLAVIAFSETDNIDRCVTVCSRLKRGDEVGIRSFEARTNQSHSFAEAVLLCEQRTPNISADKLQQILNIRSRFWDELVPPDTAFIEGAKHREVNMIEHVASIAWSLRFFPQLIAYLRGENVTL